MRFRADFIAGDVMDAYEVGHRVHVPGERIVEEWDTTRSATTTFVPRRVRSVASRWGKVIDVQQRGDGRVRVICEDVESYQATVGAILSVIGDTMVCEVDDLYDLLSFLAGQPVRTHALPDTADHFAPWLREQFPELANLPAPPDYPKRVLPGVEVLNEEMREAIATEARRDRYRAWLDGACAALGGGYVRRVPIPPAHLAMTPPTFAEAQERARAKHP